MKLEDTHLTKSADLKCAKSNSGTQTADKNQTENRRRYLTAPFVAETQSLLSSAVTDRSHRPLVSGISSPYPLMEDVHLVAPLSGFLLLVLNAGSYLTEVTYNKIREPILA